jgi:outer membrane immunogenic protein
MKKIFLSVTVVLALGSLSLNAGGKLVEPPYVPPIAVTTDNWSGPYIGAQIGYIKGKANSTLNFNNRTYLSDVYIDTASRYTASSKPSGLIGGLYVGYNKLSANNWLVGIELAGNYTNIKKSASLLDSGGNSTGATINIKQKGEVALYGKLGKVLGQNNSTLFYGLVGVTGTKLDASYTNANSVTLSDKATVYGFTVGSGLEYKINKNWHTRVQYRFSKYEDAKLDFSKSVSGSVNNYKTHSVMLGVSYHF